jgi:type IV secretion system protein VirB4
MALQFGRYRTLRSLRSISRFDPGGRARHGGDWHDLGGALSDGGENPVALQPWPGSMTLPSEDGPPNDQGDPGREKIEITPEVKDHLWSALALASAPMQERTLTGLSVLQSSS